MKKWTWLTLLLVCAFVFAACADKKDDSAGKVDEETASDPAEDGVEDDVTDEGNLPPVTVHLKDRDGKSVGTAELAEEEDGLRIMVDAKDLPEGTHGFHFHEKGVCEAPDFESAGGHFNPTNASHGLDHKEGPHAGDMPNLKVDADGTVKKEFTVKNLTLENDEENSLFQDGGTALVIHAEADDGKTLLSVKFGSFSKSHSGSTI